MSLNLVHSGPLFEPGCFWQRMLLWRTSCIGMLLASLLSVGFEVWIQFYSCVEFGALQGHCHSSCRPLVVLPGHACACAYPWLRALWQSPAGHVPGASCTARKVFGRFSLLPKGAAINLREGFVQREQDHNRQVQRPTRCLQVSCTVDACQSLFERVFPAARSDTYFFWLMQA